jgi:fibronectin type 3 domain-containing protein
VNLSLIGEASYTDGTVKAGETYYYAAPAVDSDNSESTYSNNAPATVPSP